MSLDKKRSTTARRVSILQQLDLNGQVEVISLSKEFSVSEVTIRNDLNKLEKKKVLVRTRGGAFKSDRVGMDSDISDKNKLFFL